MRLETAKIREMYERVRQAHSLVQCITNMVTVNDCANILLAAGASATMAHHPAEAAEVQSNCDALVCNLGATDDYEAMLIAAGTAGAAGHPVVMDPVGCGGSSFRRKQAMKLAQTGAVRCIRGNASEIRALYYDAATVTGVDGKADQKPEEILETRDAAVKLAQKFGTIVVASGATDMVTDGDIVYEVEDGDPMMTRITGSGCMASVLLAAYLAAADRAGRPAFAERAERPAFAERTDRLAAAAAACHVWGICGRRAAEQTRKENAGTMTFRLHLIDAMSLL